MLEGDTFSVILILSVMAGITAVISFFMGAVADEYFELRRAREFSKDFEAALQHSQPSWEEMKEIARIHDIRRSRILRTYQKAMKKILTGESKELEPHKELIRSYINKYNEEEPFEGMPSDIRIHLERLREKIDDRVSLLDPLTNQIKDLLAINEKEKRLQKYYTVGGFFVGVIGLMFAFYSWYSSPSSEDMATQATSQVEVEKK